MGDRIGKRLLVVAVVAFAAACSTVDGENGGGGYGTTPVPHDCVTESWDPLADKLIQKLAERNQSLPKGWGKQLRYDPNDPDCQFTRVRKLAEALAESLNQTAVFPDGSINGLRDEEEVAELAKLMTDSLAADRAENWHVDSGPPGAGAPGWLNRGGNLGEPPVVSSREKAITLWYLIKDALDM